MAKDILRKLQLLTMTSLKANFETENNDIKHNIIISNNYFGRFLNF